MTIRLLKVYKNDLSKKIKYKTCRSTCISSYSDQSMNESGQIGGD